MRRIAIFALLGLLLSITAQAQSRPRSPGGATARAGGIPGLVITIRGSLKKLTKKEILIESDEHQLMTLRCSGKTKFFDKDNKSIKPAEIDLESVLAIDAQEDLDSKLMAVTVKVVSAASRSLGK